MQIKTLKIPKVKGLSKFVKLVKEFNIQVETFKILSCYDPEYESTAKTIMDKLTYLDKVANGILYAEKETLKSYILMLYIPQINAVINDVKKVHKNRMCFLNDFYIGKLDQLKHLSKV